MARPRIRPLNDQLVVKRVEDFARREGLTEVTATLLDRVRREMPVDFSKRLPSFLRRED